MRLDDASPSGVPSVLDPVDLARQIAPLNPRISVAIRNRRRTREVAEMPYSKTADLPAAVKTLPKAKRNKWMTVFNSAHKSYAGDTDGEQKAFATAWAAVHESKKKDKAACEFEACDRTACEQATCPHKMLSEHPLAAIIAAQRELYDPSQPRAEDGKWTGGGGVSNVGAKIKSIQDKGEYPGPGTPGKGPDQSWRARISNKDAASVMKKIRGMGPDPMHEKRAASTRPSVGGDDPDRPVNVKDLPPARYQKHDDDPDRPRTMTPRSALHAGAVARGAKRSAAGTSHRVVETATLKGEKPRYMVLVNGTQWGPPGAKIDKSGAADTTWESKKEADAAYASHVAGKKLSEGDVMGRLLHNYELNTGARRLMLFPRGEFSHPDYGQMTFDDEFFNDIVQNYDGKVLGNTKPFIDVDHNHGAACAWVEGLSIEPDGLFGTVDWTSLGEELVSSGKYRYLSPWWGSYKDPSSGKTYDRVLRGGALTNIPFLKVLPPVELYEPGRDSAARTLAFAGGVEFKLSEMTPLSPTGGTSIEQLGTRIRAAFNEQLAPRVSQLPMSSPWWLAEIFDDHVIAGYGEGATPATYYSIPLSMDAGEYTFDLDQKQEVQQAWEPVPPDDQHEQGLSDVRTLLTRYGASRAVAHVLRETRQQTMLRLLAGRFHGALSHAATP